VPVHVSAGSRAVSVRTLDDLPGSARRVLVRVDYNVPLAAGHITDDSRITASLNTLTELLDAGRACIVASHLGRPKGPDPALSMSPVAQALADMLERPVLMAADASRSLSSALTGEEGARAADEMFGADMARAAAGLSPGEVLLLENLRFHPGEKATNPDFAARLAALADAYVDDAFGTAHRAEASTVGVPALCPGFAGRLMERELVALDRLVHEPARPFVAVVGGAKVSGKLQLLRRLLELADRVVVGGGIANTFLAAQGIPMGDSLVEADLLEEARTLAASAADRLVLPSDLVLGDRFGPDANTKVSAASDGVPSGWSALDIGPESVAACERALAGARTVVWNGPLGAFELAPFAEGTLGAGRAIADLPDAYTVVGGGDSIAALNQAGLEDRVSWVSTGGGAMLALLAGEPLPAVLALAT
jgi:phosphoglycerate kinase